MERGHTSPLLIFDFSDEHGRYQRRTFSNPVAVISTNSIDEVRAAMTHVQEWVDRGYYAAGYISYEASPAFDPAYIVHPNEIRNLDTLRNANLRLRRLDTCRENYTESIRKIKHAISRGETYQVNYTMRLRGHFKGDDSLTGPLASRSRNVRDQQGRFSRSSNL